jgi:hypothetical protein
MGVADLRYESSFMEFLKPRLKLTFGYVQIWHSYLYYATPKIMHFAEKLWAEIENQSLKLLVCHLGLLCRLIQQARHKSVYCCGKKLSIVSKKMCPSVSIYTLKY